MGHLMFCGYPPREHHEYLSGEAGGGELGRTRWNVLAYMGKNKERVDVVLRTGTDKG